MKGNPEEPPHNVCETLQSELVSLPYIPENIHTTTGILTPLSRLTL
jgi:hypothetical protein